MNTQNDEIILNQDGEPTDLTTTEDFGRELAFLNPEQMPDLEQAEVGINIQPESIEFKQVGEYIRAVFNGFTELKVKDKINKGQYVMRKAAVLQTKTGIKINMGANMLKQLALIPPGTAVQITYKGEERTNSGNDVKVYDVHLLNVPRVNLPVLPHKANEQKSAPVPGNGKPHFTNEFLATEFWTAATSKRMTREDGLDHLAAHGNDFEEALATLDS